MPRGPRLDAPGVVHHVTLRGIGKLDLFADDDDREDLCSRLDFLIPELGFCCLASAFMSNHVHLVLRSGDAVRISRLMASLCTGYALYFSRRHGWVGHVFQNRFGSSRIGDDAYLRAAIAYVHRNPVDAGMMSLEELATYPWTTHSAALGTRAPRAFESIEETLAPFHGDARELVESVARPTSLPNDLQWRKLPRKPLMRALARNAQPVALTFEALLAQVCGSVGVAIGRVLSRDRSRAVAEARRQIARRAIREVAISQAEVARLLGVTESAVAQMVARAAQDGPTSKAS
jgi:REP element-mobilizing transposase RayT